MKRKLNIFAGDISLWVIFFFLTAISLIAVYSTIGLSAIAESHTTPSAEFFKHVGFVLVTYIMVILMSHINYRTFSKFVVPLFLFGICALILVYFVGGARHRWIYIPFLPFGVQPSEFAKIFLILFLARTIALNYDNLDDNNYFWSHIGVPVFGTCGLIFAPNLSTAILLFLTCFFLLFFAGYNTRRWWKWFAIIMIGGVLLFMLIYWIGDKADVFRSSTWGHRLQNWLNPNPDELSQENMARMAVARGGLFGQGIGTTIHGRLTTQAHNDFIFAFIIEEKGLIAAIGIFILYAFFYFRCIRIAVGCKGRFGSLCVAGLGTVIFLQALINMSVAVGLLPVTGQTLPFISYGGSSYLALGLAMGVIQSVAADNRKQARLAKAQPATPETLNDETVKSEPVNQ